jgi:hypothetical protein
LLKSFATATRVHFNSTLSPELTGRWNNCLFNSLHHKHESQATSHEKEIAVLATEDELLVDLTFHNVPVSLLTEFAEKIVRPYFSGNLNVAIQDLMNKALAEQDFFLSRITHIKSQNSG